MVSHSMDDVAAALAERVIVMNHGKVAMDGAPREVFSRGKSCAPSGWMPQAVELAQKLREKGFDVPEGIYKIEEVRAAVEAIVGKGGRHA